MLHFRLITLALLIALHLTVGCSPSQQPTATLSPEESQLTSSDALLIAKKAATDEGLQLDDYNVPTVVYDDSRGQRRWWGHFDGKRNAFGDHFSVRVTDGVHAAEVYLGR